MTFYTGGILTFVYSLVMFNVHSHAKFELISKVHRIYP